MPANFYESICVPVPDLRDFLAGSSANNNSGNSNNNNNNSNSNSIGGGGGGGGGFSPPPPPAAVSSSGSNSASNASTPAGSSSSNTTSHPPSAQPQVSSGSPSLSIQPVSPPTPPTPPTLKMMTSATTLSQQQQQQQQQLNNVLSSMNPSRLAVSSSSNGVTSYLEGKSIKMILLFILNFNIKQEKEKMTKEKKRKKWESSHNSSQLYAAGVQLNMRRCSTAERYSRKTGDTKETEINNTQIPPPTPPVIRKRAVLRIISSFLFLFFWLCCLDISFLFAALIVCVSLPPSSHSSCNLYNSQFSNNWLDVYIHQGERFSIFIIFRQRQRKVSKWILELKNRRDTLSIYIYNNSREERETERE